MSASTVDSTGLEQQRGLFHEIYDEIAPPILEVGQVPLIKEALTYQTVADKLHILVIGNPECSAKSENCRYAGDLLRRDFVEGIYKYFTFAGDTTEKGLSDDLVELKEGLMHVDEIGMAPGKDVGTLMDVLQYQELNVSKHQQNFDVRTDVNVYATANPEGYNKKWQSYGNPQMMKNQVPISNALHRRFHLTICTAPYTEDESDKVNRHIAEYQDDDAWRDPQRRRDLFQTILAVRSKEVKLEVPDKVFKLLKKFKRFENMLAMPITSEFTNGVYEVAKAHAKLRSYSEGPDKVIESDWKHAINFIMRCMKTAGLSNALVQKKLGL